MLNSYIKGLLVHTTKSDSNSGHWTDVMIIPGTWLFEKNKYKGAGLLTFVLNITVPPSPVQ